MCVCPCLYVCVCVHACVCCMCYDIYHGVFPGKDLRDKTSQCHTLAKPDVAVW